MPTPKGKPQVGETIEWIGTYVAHGRVLQRSDGDIWSFKVLWLDGPRRGQEKWITEAAYWKYEERKGYGWKVVNN